MQRNEIRIFLIKKYEISFSINFHSRLDFLEEIEIGQKYSNTKQTYNSTAFIECSSIALVEI